jgi:hypothetical protein
MVGVCSFFLLRLFPQWLSAWNEPSKLVVDLFPIGVLSLLTVAGAVLLRYYFTDHRRELRIDSVGVHYAGHSYPWAEVGSLSGRWDRSRVRLLLHRRGRIALDRHLQTDEGLTEDQYTRPIEHLVRDVASIHPHLRLG